MSQETQLAVSTPIKKQLATAALAERMQCDPGKLITTLRATVFKGANTDEEVYALVLVANAYGLNPLTKEIYAFPAKGGGIVPVVSVDGWIRMMNDHPQFDGIEFEDHHDEKGNIVAITSLIYRKDRTRPMKVTEYYSECYRNTEPWKMPHRMLRHKALIQGARVAFGFSGIHDEDEAKDITGSATEIPKAQVTNVTPTATTTVTDNNPEVLPAAAKKTTPKATRPAQPETPAEAPAEKKPAPVVDAAPGAAEETTAPKTTKATAHQELEAKLQAAGYEPETCVKMAISMVLAPKTATSLLEIPPKNVVSILEDWDTAVDAMKQIKAANL